MERENETKSSLKQSAIDYMVMLPVLAILIITCIMLLINVDESTKAIKSVLTWIEYKLGWAYLLALIATSIFSIWLAFGRFGKVKLCAPGEKPAFSIFGWFSMIFMTTMAASIMVWGFIEPAYYFKSPPFGIEAFSNEAYEWALTQTMFHWSPIPYSIYVPFSVTLAYFIHVRKMQFFKVSQACIGVIGEKNANGLVGKIIDILVLFGVIGGMSTSFGMAIPVVLAGVSKITGGDPESTGMMVILMASWILVFGVSLYRGLDKGIKVLSNFNVIIGFVFVGLVFVLSDSIFALKMGVTSLGQMIQNLPILTTNMDPIANTGFVEGWTVFYWAWYVGFAAAVGLFISKISKGRTIREVVFGSTVAISAGVFIIQIIFGSYVIDLQISGVFDVATALKDLKSQEVVLKIIETLPMGTFMVVMHTLLLFTFVATSLDSTAFTCASLSTVKLQSDEEPATKNKMVWAVILLVLTGTLATIGGLSAVQVSALVVSAPLLIITLILCIALVKVLKEDYPSSDDEFIYIDYENKKVIKDLE